MNHKVMTICAVAREVCVAAWAKVTNAQNEHSDSLLGSFGHQATAQNEHSESLLGPFGD